MPRLPTQDVYLRAVPADGPAAEVSLWWGTELARAPPADTSDTSTTRGTRSLRARDAQPRSWVPVAGGSLCCRLLTLGGCRMKVSHRKLVVIRYQMPRHDPWPGAELWRCSYVCAS
jgi:hypothetical protein